MRYVRRQMHTSGCPSARRSASGSKAEAGVFSVGCGAGLADSSVSGI